jgi:hypothetical protein
MRSADAGASAAERFREDVTTAPARPATPEPSSTTAPDTSTALRRHGARGQSLAILDHDELSASCRAPVGLDHTSLDAIRRYELAHRGRNTILGKITQLG